MNTSFMAKSGATAFLMTICVSVPAIAQWQDTTTPPAHEGRHLDTMNGFDFLWFTDAELTSRSDDCYALNSYIHTIHNQASTALAMQWNDGGIVFSGRNPLPSLGVQNNPIQTTAGDFELIAPSIIQLGQFLNYSAQAASYQPVKNVDNCPTSARGLLPPALESTLSRSIMIDQQASEITLTLQSRPFWEGRHIFVAQSVESADLNGAVVGFSHLPIHLSRLDNITRSNAVNRLTSLRPEGTDVPGYQATLLEKVLHPDELQFIPNSLRNAEYGFITIYEDKLLFDLPAAEITNEETPLPLNEEWHSIVLIDLNGTSLEEQNGSLLAMGLASMWMPVVADGAGQ